MSLDLPRVLSIRDVAEHSTIYSVVGYTKLLVLLLRVSAFRGMLLRSLSHNRLFESVSLYLHSGPDSTSIQGGLPGRLVSRLVRLSTSLAFRLPVSVFIVFVL